MVYEFEGRTEKEAIDRAAAELGLERDKFDVEILETQKSGLFKKGYVRIRVHTNEPAPKKTIPMGKPVYGNPEPQNEFEQQLVTFIGTLIEKMGYPGKVIILFREEQKIGIKIDSEYSSILIGKKGKNLDAIQLLANIYTNKLGYDSMKIIIDAENYRIRREESLVRLAYSVADKVRETKGSILLEPMNPFERRLIHTTLNDIADVETKSEGEGLYKQVRVYYKGSR
ncbi:MAG: protein jag [Treponemataceae bacterium]|nr:protein jag [Treponemataceae bacterium]